MYLEVVLKIRSFDLFFIDEKFYLYEICVKCLLNVRMKLYIVIKIILVW